MSRFLSLRSFAAIVVPFLLLRQLCLERIGVLRHHGRVGGWILHDAVGNAHHGDAVTEAKWFSVGMASWQAARLRTLGRGSTRSRCMVTGTRACGSREELRGEVAPWGGSRTSQNSGAPRMGLWVACLSAVSRPVTPAMLHCSRREQPRTLLWTRRHCRATDRIVDILRVIRMTSGPPVGSGHAVGGVYPLSTPHVAGLAAIMTRESR